MVANVEMKRDVQLIMFTVLWVHRFLPAEHFEAVLEVLGPYSHHYDGLDCNPCMNWP